LLAPSLRAHSRAGVERNTDGFGGLSRHPRISIAYTSKMGMDNRGGCLGATSRPARDLKMRLEKTKKKLFLLRILVSTRIGNDTV
jgi:hypothetical protein